LKLHRHLVLEVIAILQSIFADGVYSDKAIEAALKSHPKWGARDRHFVAETVYESVRWWRRVWHCMDVKANTTKDSLFEFIAALWVIEDKEIPDWEELQDLDVEAIKSRWQNLDRTSADYHALPTWLHELGKSELGEKWNATIEGLNRKADVVLRVNMLKTIPKALIAELQKEMIEAETIEGYPEALRLVKRANVFRTNAFKDGLFEVQDAASQKVVQMLEPAHGERVIDACAGAGGKSLHLATRMKNKGKVIALDIHDWKLEELKKRARRNGIDIIETRVIDSSKIIKRLEESADAVLLDVPCTGLGALRRNPDSKWKQTPQGIQELLETQQKILQDYSKMTKPGGRMVYATCSILPSENEKQVQKFLESAKDWKLLQEHREWPHINGFDGFYMALLTRS
jgi:16S rRNA (cytosine967-C5)-methyltransferase